MSNITTNRRIVLFSGVEDPYANNVITNGGFNDGSTNWVQEGGTITPVYSGGSVTFTGNGSSPSGIYTGSDIPIGNYTLYISFEMTEDLGFVLQDGFELFAGAPAVNSTILSTGGVIPAGSYLLSNSITISGGNQRIMLDVGSLSNAETLTIDFIYAIPT